MHHQYRGKNIPHAKDLRKNMTKEERKLWYEFLREYPLHFYRQRPIGNYIIDFYCPDRQLAIELDGSQHFENTEQRYDAARTDYLARLGIRVLRIPNNEILGNFRGVCEQIVALTSQSAALTAPLSGEPIHRRKENPMKKVTIYTDGACSGNPGPGGWGAILRYGERMKELSGGEKETTNNRMELLGAISALSALKEPCEVELYTDSQYLSNAINLGWLRTWKSKGWTRKGGELKNIDLWKELDGLLNTHSVKFFWVKGHADNEFNNRCDALAVAERDKYSV